MACHNVVRVLAGWQRRGEMAAVVAAMGVPWHCQGGGVAGPAWCVVRVAVAAAGMLWCWWGSSGGDG